MELKEIVNKEFSFISSNKIHIGKLIIDKNTIYFLSDCKKFDGQSCSKQDIQYKYSFRLSYSLDMNIDLFFKEYVLLI